MMSDDWKGTYGGVSIKNRSRSKSTSRSAREQEHGRNSWPMSVLLSADSVELWMVERRLRRDDEVLVLLRVETVDDARMTVPPSEPFERYDAAVALKKKKARGRKWGPRRCLCAGDPALRNPSPYRQSTGFPAASSGDRFTVVSSTYNSNPAVLH